MEEKYKAYVSGRLTVLFLITILMLMPAIKADSPNLKVELFVYSYCPYGTQMEKALFPVYDLLKDKVDINIVYIGAMHGEFEHEESLRQIAILNLYSKDKLFDYLKQFDANSNIGSCSDDATCLNSYRSVIYTNLGINQSQVEQFMNTSSELIYQQNEAEANKRGISGSPTLVIMPYGNDGSSALTQMDSGRNSESIKEWICIGFNSLNTGSIDYTPNECSQILSLDSPSPGFGSSVSSASSSSNSASAGGTNSGVTSSAITSNENTDRVSEENSVTNENNNPSNNSNQNICNGCKFQESCIPFGYKLKNEQKKSVYCDISKDLKLQKEQNISCQNNFECLSGQCSEGACINLQKTLEENNSLLQKIIDFLKELFGFK